MVQNKAKNAHLAHTLRQPLSSARFDKITHRFYGVDILRGKGQRTELEVCFFRQNQHFLRVTSADLHLCKATVCRAEIKKCHDREYNGY